MTTGSPDATARELEKLERTGISLISNDAAVPGHSKGRLLSRGMLKKITASHVGLNPEVAAQMAAGLLDLQLVPQGTLIEQIRCGGAGLGGVLTPTGVGTIIEEGKQKISIGSKEYILETAVRADTAILYGSKADRLGNISFRGSTINFNALMAMAADMVIVEVEEIVATGEIAPEEIRIPHIFVDFLVLGDQYKA